LGGYLARLYRYGPPSDDADVITQWIPDRQIVELAIACRALGHVAPGGPHRLIDLAGGFADAAAITSAHATRDQRWAFAVATVEEIDHLATVVAVANPIGTGARVRADRVRAAALPIHQRAARQPPTRAANALLDAPIPDAGNPWPPRTQNTTVGVAIDAAMATLLAGTRPSAQPLTIAEVLAIAMAADSLCRAVDDPFSHTRPGTAADAWSGVRASLAPFNDGSRRRQHTTGGGRGWRRHLHLHWSANQFDARHDLSLPGGGLEYGGHQPGKRSDLHHYCWGANRDHPHRQPH
jgi:hypothetical protein